MKINGVQIPSVGQLMCFIKEDFHGRVEKDLACKHAWEMYMDLALLVEREDPTYDNLFMAAYAMMGAHWAYCDH